MKTVCLKEKFVNSKNFSLRGLSARAITKVHKNVFTIIEIYLQHVRNLTYIQTKYRSYLK